MDAFNLCVLSSFSKSADSATDIELKQVENPSLRIVIFFQRLSSSIILQLERKSYHQIYKV